MRVEEFLRTNAQELLAGALNAMARAHLPSYEKSGPAETEQRLHRLFELTVRCLEERNLTPMRAHARNIAEQRYRAGFDLWEVQTAFNVLEEAIWLRLLRDLPPAEYGEALALVSTVLGVGKDTLAQTFVTLASKTRAPSLNVQSLFRGTEGEPESN